MTVTKKLRFDNDVIDVLRNMEWKDDGRLGVIVQQLERNLYTKVNKALETMGGAWNRKLKGHLFPADPRQQVEGLIESGELVVDNYGWFPTPDNVIDEMIKLCGGELHGWVLEPSAGDGAIVKRIMRFDDVQTIDAVEIHTERINSLFEVGKDYGRLWVFEGDFLGFSTGSKYDFILMNPPFENHQAEKHIKHALGYLADGGKLVSVVPSSINVSKAMNGYEMYNYLTPLPAGSFKELGTLVNTALLVVEAPED